MTIDKLREVYVQLDVQCTALRARISEVQRERTTLAGEHERACRALATDEVNKVYNPDLGRSVVPLSEKVAIAEARLRGLQLLLTDQEQLTAAAHASLLSAVIAENQKKQALETEEKRQRLTAACRKALKLRDGLVDEVLAAKATMEQKQHAFLVADYFFREALEEYQKLETNFTASDAEVAERHREVTSLKADRLTAMRERDEAIAQCGASQRAWQQACAEYEHASNVLRWNVPAAEAKRRAIPAIA